MAEYGGIDDWQPPSEAEMKIIEARRERSDRISKVMGQYLLKGYKMLAVNCGVCCTILLQDRQSNFYCVACSEVDPEVQKDSPALCQEAAERQRQESQFSSHVRTPVSTIASTTGAAAVSPVPTIGEPSIPDVPLATGSEPLVPTGRFLPRVLPSELCCDPNEVVGSCVADVFSCLEASRAQLSNATSLKQTKEILSVIKACADTLASLKKVQ